LAVPLICGVRLSAAEKSDKPNPADPVDSFAKAEGFKSTVLFAAKDSVIYNIDGRTMELLGNACIDHEETSVKAPKIIIDLNTSLFHAFGIADSLKTGAEPAVFTDRMGSFNAETITYNFKTKRGETTNVLSSSKQIIFSGERVTRLENGEMIIRDGTFTTCDNPSPHYWFSASRMTVMPDKRIIAKPLIMYIRPEIFSARLPALPILALPYMVFPLNQARSSGFLMPSLGKNSHIGYYLSNFGYFWAVDDQMDFRLDGDMSFNGGWRLGERLRYKKTNNFSGEIAGEYKEYLAYNDWNAKIIYNQAFESSTRFDVNILLQGAPQGYDLNSMNSITMVTQQSNARAALAKMFNEENSMAAITYNRSEDLSTLNATQTIEASFYQNRMYPFRSGSPVEDWRTNVSLSTGASFRGISTSETTSGYSANANVELGYYHAFAQGTKALFTQGISLQATQPISGFNNNEINNGTTLFVPLRIQSTLFHYFNINPGVTFIHSLSPDGAKNDISTTVFAVDATTRLYGTLESGVLDNLFGLHALRHTFIPTITYRWNPASSGTVYNSYQNIYDWTDSQLFNRFENNTYAGMPEGQSTVGISLKNIIHGKKRGAAPSFPDDGSPGGEQKIQLLSLNASTAYNFNADAFHLAPLILTASSNVLSPNLLFSSGAMYDIYSFDPLTGNRINRFNSDDGNGLFRFVKGFLDMSLSIQGSQETSSSSASLLPTTPLVVIPNASQSIFLNRFNANYFSNIDYRQPWQFQFSLFLQSDRSNPLEPVTTSLINASATALLSKDWQVLLNTGYDLQNRKLAFPMLYLNRDLHCWQTSFQCIPFGQFRSYAIQIGLKAPLSSINVKAGKGAY